MSKGAAAKAATVADVKVDLTKVDPTLVKKALKGYGVDTKDLVIDDMAERLQTLNRKSVEPDKLVTCMNCSGCMDNDLDLCPFCGDEGEEASAEGAATALTKVPEVEIIETPMTAKALDEATARIKQLTTDARHGYWRLGKEIFHVFSTKLWAVRMKHGKQAYRSFEKYCAAELEMAHTTAFNMMGVAEKFTEEQVAKIGGSKLSLLLKAPEIDQDEILDDLNKGASFRDVQAKVKEKRKKRGVTKKAHEGRKKMPAKAGPKPTNRMTVALVTGVATLKMFAKPEQKLKEGEKLEKRAKQVADNPIAIEVMSNGVERYYSITRTSEGLSLKIETKRPA